MPPTRPPGETEIYPPYEAFLNQSVHWPATESLAGPVETVSIAEMAPQHAVSAYHKLLRWRDTFAGASSGALPVPAFRETPLMHALVNQALGYQLPANWDFPDDLDDEEVLTTLIQASQDATGADAVFHYRVANSIQHSLIKAGYRVVRV
jgi:hypothetical protein